MTQILRPKNLAGCLNEANMGKIQLGIYFEMKWQWE